MTSIATADEIMAAASEASGLDDFGEPGLHEALTQYVTSLSKEASLSEAGVSIIETDTTGVLVNRLRMERDIGRHPEILTRKVSAPLVIAGLPRTGTTKLQQLIARDPETLKIPYWLAANPAPLPDAPDDGPDPRIAVAEEQIRLMAEHAPELLSAHTTSAHEPEEDAFPWRMSFETTGNGTFDNAPSYRDWLAGRSHNGAYDYLKRILQYLGWQNGWNENHAWVLKTPVHSGHLDSLLRTFPDVTLVQCHRDLQSVIPSTMRMMEVFWVNRGHRNSPVEVADYHFPLWADQLAANVRQRADLQGRLRVVDVRYADIVNDVDAVIRSIYSVWGRPISAAARAAMASWETENPQYRHGKHVYSHERYGLSRSQIDNAFTPYLDRFGDLLT